MSVTDRVLIAAGCTLALIGALAAFAALGGTGNTLAGAIAIAAAVAVYLLPSLIARQRHVPNVGSVVVVNVLLGWTVIGWIVALAMAMRDRPEPPGSAALQHLGEPGAELPGVAVDTVGEPPGEVGGGLGDDLEAAVGQQDRAAFGVAVEDGAHQRDSDPSRLSPFRGLAAHRGS